MAETATFSSSGVDAITRPIHLEEEVPDILSQAQLEESYDIARTVDEIEKGDYKRIALQFSDELLPHSVPIFRALKSRTTEGREFYVLADTSYGSCCVDEVAAQHVDADALVHYGHACMSQTSRLPVIYVLGKKPIDVSHCVESFAEVVPNLSDKHSIVLKYDVAYAYEADLVITALKNKLSSSTRILHTPVTLTSHPASSGQHRTPQELQETGADPSPDSNVSPEKSAILYIGGESLTLTNLLLTHASYEVYAYDPKTRTARLESGRTNKLLMRRYVAVQKARDADVIGILVGTLGVANYLPLISHLRTLLARAQKKSYTISVGKLAPAKLANFLEIEAFVLVACPENSVLDAKEFLRPIVTPYELEVALRPTQEWTGRYVLNFEELLREGQAESEGASVSAFLEGPADPDQPVFSLVSGKYRHAKRYGGKDEGTANGDTDSSAVVLRNQGSAVAIMSDSAAAHFLQQRTYQGLETRVGQDAPSLLEQGRSGIARGYGDDHREGSSA
ncbi:diphthamide biosynthesis protein [Dichomitus squalens LYAD-421 SS1]|uniref:2-(3-amino-3-carboxypropyl)histidine synthase subunit 2 n=2 Tax=Dichomitus squalens TaxID=114155 RepID=A0A4Q9MAW8_9APHY|nr:diphthamide biosynthesis protein [Dichomitus squalens LYAD-421 SS1]EJF62071.1 diphthamide biosynthesis protein [Dichomitus squalens LYAD-421 SS1]TBU23388.1 diphthamide biosynthesis protein [Dichomitus squalens]